MEIKCDYCGVVAETIMPETVKDGEVEHTFYCCSASRPSMEGETKEDEKEVQTEELAIIASALANGYVKAKTSVNTSDAIYNNWYNEVYMPTATQEDSGNGGAEGGDSGNESGNDDENAGD